MATKRATELLDRVDTFLSTSYDALLDEAVTRVCDSAAQPFIRHVNYDRDWPSLSEDTADRRAMLRCGCRLLSAQIPKWELAPLGGSGTAPHMFMSHEVIRRNCSKFPDLYGEWVYRPPSEAEIAERELNIAAQAYYARVAREEREKDHPAIPEDNPSMWGVEIQTTWSMGPGTIQVGEGPPIPIEGTTMRGTRMVGAVLDECSDFIIPNPACPPAAAVVDCSAFASDLPFFTRNLPRNDD